MSEGAMSKRGPRLLIPESWPRIGVGKPKPLESWPRRFYEFIVMDFNRDGGCIEHPRNGAYFVVDYAYEYPNGMIRNMAAGWVCAGCLERGWCWDGINRVTIHPHPKYKGAHRR